MVVFALAPNHQGAGGEDGQRDRCLLREEPGRQVALEVEEGDPCRVAQLHGAANGRRDVHPVVELLDVPVVGAEGSSHSSCCFVQEAAMQRRLQG
eukprot:274843-Lingulodinium_polyedra.AAC.1